MPKQAEPKPKKPYPDFPLFAHATGRWAKKIRGKFHYFGPWRDPDTALTKYLENRDDLQAGRVPRKSDGATVRDLANRFLTSKQHRVDTGELSPRTLRSYIKSCSRVVQEFGSLRGIDDLVPEDFSKLRTSLAIGRGPHALGNEIRHVRMVFKYAFDAGLIDRPLNLGPDFKVPSKKTMRQARAARGQRMFEADQIRDILASAQQPMRVMTLLGINCAFGQTDIAQLPHSAMNFDQGMVSFPRPKTGVGRRCPLWPETINAVREAVDIRPQPHDDADSSLVFLTRQGNRWVRDNGKTHVDSVALIFGRLLTSLNLKRPGLNFYALRHTFETIGGESRDQLDYGTRRRLNGGGLPRTHL